MYFGSSKPILVISEPGKVGQKFQIGFTILINFRIVLDVFHQCDTVNYDFHAAKTGNMQNCSLVVQQNFYFSPSRIIITV